MFDIIFARATRDNLLALARRSKARGEHRGWRVGLIKMARSYNRDIVREMRQAC